MFFSALMAGCMRFGRGGEEIMQAEFGVVSPEHDANKNMFAFRTYAERPMPDERDFYRTGHAGQ